MQTRTLFLFEKLRNEHSSAFATVDTFMLRNADEQRPLDSVRDDGKRFFRSLQIELNLGAEKGSKEAQKRGSRALATGERIGGGNDSRITILSKGRLLALETNESLVHGKESTKLSKGDLRACTRRFAIRVHAQNTIQSRQVERRRSNVHVGCKFAQPDAPKADNRPVGPQQQARRASSAHHRSDTGGRKGIETRSKRRASKAEPDETFLDGKDSGTCPNGGLSTPQIEHGHDY
jgi:hypothetical protein